MITSPRALRTVDVVSALMLGVALATFLWPVRPAIPKADAMATSPVLTTGAAAAASADDASSIVAQNIFSSSRHAPSVRYSSPDLANATEYSMPAAFARPTIADSTRTVSDDPDAIPSLYGIVNSDGGWRALLRLDNADANPVLLREGDRRGSYRVVSIRAKEVIVAGPSGQRTLRLAQPARNDSTGKPL